MGDNRIYAVINGERLRVQKHNSDPDLLVLKSTHKELLDTLIAATGVDPDIKKTFDGKNYKISFVTREGAGKLFAAIASGIGKMEFALSSNAPENAEAADYDNDDSDD